MFSFGVTLVMAMGEAFEELMNLEEIIRGILGCKSDQDQTACNLLKQSFKKSVIEIVKMNIQNTESPVAQNKLPNNEIKLLVQIITGFLDFDRKKRLSLENSLNLVSNPSNYLTTVKPHEGLGIIPNPEGGLLYKPHRKKSYDID